MGRFSASRPFLARLRRAYPGGAAVRRATGPVFAAALALAVPVAPATAQVAVGGEFRVNTTTTDSQRQPAVGMAADGSFVVAWLSGRPNLPSVVRGQRYDADGVALGGEFQISETPPSFVSAPVVAVNAAGHFVVVWQTSSPSSVYARRFAADGTPEGGEILVGAGSYPAMGMDADGDFVIVWEAGGISGRRYAADGTPQGEAFVVPDSYQQPAVSVAPDGGFVVAWQDWADDDPEGTWFIDIYGRRYDADGVAQGGRLRLNTSRFGSQLNPLAATAADGDFVVLWEQGLSFQRFDAQGVRQGSETGVGLGGRAPYAIAMDAGGGFVVVGEVTAPGDISNVRAKTFDASGAAGVTLPLVNTYTTGEQQAPAVAMDADGDFVVVWASGSNVTGVGQDGDRFGIYAQRYRRGGVVGTAPEAGGSADLALIPNPVTGAGVVHYVVPEAAHVRVAVYDVLGREVAVLADGEQAAGRHGAALDAAALAPGAYLLRLTAGETALVRRITVAR